MIFGSTLKRKTPLRTKKPMRRSASRLRSKQRPVTPSEQVLWDQLASEIGCISCRIEGRFNDYVSIHHIDGRTKLDCHKKVLPLCASHHQDDGTAIAVHPDKARFEARYGAQMELNAECFHILERKGLM